jgi:tRNA1Val (adenine37-N6)-methyltransferase
MHIEGIIRRARRPRGWLAPGPPPRTPADRADVWPAAGEDLCFLAGDWRILQRLGGHRWSLDDLVTAWWAARVPREPPARAVDLGCGIGTVLLLLAWRFPAARLIGIEAQESSVRLARRSLAFNGADDRCTVRLGDFRDPASSRGLGLADLVTGTPPYLPPGTGTESSRPQCGPCRFEHRGGAEDYARAAAELLAERGVFVACAAARQHGRVGAAAAAAGLVLDTWRDVVPREGKAPLFGVYSMRRPAAAQARDPEPPLVVRDRRGRWTAEFGVLRREMGLPV